MEKLNGGRLTVREQDILGNVVECVNEAMVTIDQCHIIVFFNNAAERMFGYEKAEVLNEDLSILLGQYCPRDHYARVQQYISTRRANLIGRETKMTATRKNGSPFPVSISFSVAEIDGAQYFTGIVRDLTEEKRLQEELNRSERLAALGKAVAEISHEIENPLVTIGGFARQLMRSIEDDRQRAKVTFIAEEVDRLEKLLAEMKDYYRPKGTRRDTVQINGLLRDIKKYLEPYDWWYRPTEPMPA